MTVPPRGSVTLSGFVPPGLNQLCFSILKFWGFLASGNHTKPQRETQLKPPGFTCFHNKTRSGAEFALGRFGDLWRSFHSISRGCERSGCCWHPFTSALQPSAGCWGTETWPPSSLWRNPRPCAEATSAARGVFSSLLSKLHICVFKNNPFFFS